MRMKFRCKNYGKMFYFHDRMTGAIVAFMEARQTMWKIIWNKDFNSKSDVGINSTINKGARCCRSPYVQILAFHGDE